MTRDPVLKDGEKVAESHELGGCIRSVYSSSISEKQKGAGEEGTSPVPSSYVSVDFAVRCAA